MLAPSSKLAVLKDIDEIMMLDAFLSASPMLPGAGFVLDVAPVLDDVPGVGAEVELAGFAPLL